jgi:glycosyltransferase involved in cell wall biosynthesis
MVVSTRTSGAISLLRNGYNGLFFDLDTPETFHKALEQALAKSETARQLLSHGADEVSRKYNLNTLAGRMKRLYEELIEEKRCVT